MALEKLIQLSTEGARQNDCRVSQVKGQGVFQRNAVGKDSLDAEAMLYGLSRFLLYEKERKSYGVYQQHHYLCVRSAE